MGNYEFNKDILIEEHTKLEIMEFLRSLGWRILDDNFDYRYDILMEKDNKTFKLEIKEDFRCAETGNIAVEFESRGKLSGISSTEADIYLYKIHLTDKIIYHVTTVKKLMKSIALTQYHRIVGGGDYMSNTRMYLYKLPVYISLGKVIHEKEIN
jgi:hypothetical protein